MEQDLIEIYRFNMILDDEAFIDYLAMMFSDEEFSKEELKPIVFQAVIRAVDMYNAKNRTVNLGIYVSTVVKKIVNTYKESR